MQARHLVLLHPSLFSYKTMTTVSYTGRENEPSLTSDLAWSQAHFPYISLAEGAQRRSVHLQERATVMSHRPRSLKRPTTTTSSASDDWLLKYMCICTIINAFKLQYRQHSYLTSAHLFRHRAFEILQCSQGCCRLQTCAPRPPNITVKRSANVAIRKLLLVRSPPTVTVMPGRTNGGLAYTPSGAPFRKPHY